MSTLSQRLATAREESGLSQMALAGKSSVTQPVISDLETGKASGSTDIAAIAAALGVQPLWLAYGKGPKKYDGPVQFVDHGVPEHILRLAQRLALLPDEKLHAVSVLLGIKL